MQYLKLIGLGVAFVAFVIAIVGWSLRGTSRVERRRLKQFYAVCLFYTTVGTAAAAVLLLYGGIHNAVLGNWTEFREMVMIGVPLSILAAVLYWLMFRWPEWPQDGQ